MPSGWLPRNRAEPVQSSPGRSARRFASSVDTWSSSLGSPNAPDIRSDSSWRCCSDIEFIIRCAAAARAASASTSSSVLRGFSGKNSPCWRMKSSNCAVVSSPRRCASRRSFRSDIIRRIRSVSSGRMFCSACFMPWKRDSISSWPSRSRIFW
jgi:hypothetical protein